MNYSQARMYFYRTREQDPAIRDLKVLPSGALIIAGVVFEIEITVLNRLRNLLPRAMPKPELLIDIFSWQYLIYDIVAGLEGESTFRMFRITSTHSTLLGKHSLFMEGILFKASLLSSNLNRV